MLSYNSYGLKKKEKTISFHLSVSEPSLHASRVPVCGTAVHSCLAVAATLALLMSSSFWDWNITPSTRIFWVEASSHMML
jgi:hypothetical protein